MTQPQRISLPKYRHVWHHSSALFLSPHFSLLTVMPDTTILYPTPKRLGNAAETPRELTIAGTAQFIREMKAAYDTGAGPYSVDDRSTRQRASPTPHATHTSYTHKLSVTESVASPALLLLLGRSLACPGVKRPQPYVTMPHTLRWRGVGRKFGTARQEGSCCLGAKFRGLHLLYICIAPSQFAVRFCLDTAA